MDREKSAGYCAVTKPRIARAAPHFFEEPPISAKRGSGAIFFVGCNMRCVFCQNSDISAKPFDGRIIDAKALASIMLELEGMGVHNINLVTPAPHVSLICEAIRRARGEGLSIPIVYNTNSYETEAAINSLSGLVDIYLPDLKYISREAASRYSDTPDYFEVASRAIDAMYNAVGALTLDEDAVARRGVLIRHLVLPGCLDEARGVLEHINRSFGADACYSLMFQYFPAYRASEFSSINRRLTRGERRRISEYALSLGMTNGFIQGLDSADEAYVPIWDMKNEN